MCRLWRADDHPIALPINVTPPKAKMLGRASQPTKATQCEQQSPLRVRAGVQHLGRILAADEVVAVPLRHDSDALHVGKGILGNQPPSHGRSEELFGNTAASPCRVVGQTLPPFRRLFIIHRAREPAPPIIGVGRRDFLKPPVVPEVFN
ncbi:MAG: hypothetical protein L0228_19045 [Planctomycetes bacterium]|nr:hypothetical protein [Planctomycetota bacterium]